MTLIPKGKIAKIALILPHRQDHRNLINKIKNPNKKHKPLLHLFNMFKNQKFQQSGLQLLQTLVKVVGLQSTSHLHLQLNPKKKLNNR